MGGRVEGLWYSWRSLISLINKCHTIAGIANINQDEVMEVLTSKISASNQIKDLLGTLFIACDFFSCAGGSWKSVDKYLGIFL